MNDNFTSPTMNDSVTPWAIGGPTQLQLTNSHSTLLYDATIMNGPSNSDLAKVLEKIESRLDRIERHLLLIFESDDPSYCFDCE